MPRKATGPKENIRGNWWTSLLGVVTGAATLLTAVAGSWVALQQMGLLSYLADYFKTVHAGSLAPPGSVKTAKIDGVSVTILSVQRIADRGASLVYLQYSVKTGTEYSSHDPANFVKMVADGRAIAPVWTSAAARDLPTNSQEDFAVKFPAPPDLTHGIVLRFGETHHLDLTTLLTE